MTSQTTATTISVASDDQAQARTTAEDNRSLNTTDMAGSSSISPANPLNTLSGMVSCLFSGSRKSQTNNVPAVEVNQLDTQGAVVQRPTAQAMKVAGVIGRALAAAGPDFWYSSQTQRRGTMAWWVKNSVMKQPQHLCCFTMAELSEAMVENVFEIDLDESAALADELKALKYWRVESQDRVLIMHTDTSERAMNTMESGTEGHSAVISQVICEFTQSDENQ